CDPDICLLALLGSCSAPGYTLTPVIPQAKYLLHLLSGDVNHHLHDGQPCEKEMQEHSEGGAQSIYTHTHTHRDTHTHTHTHRDTHSQRHTHTHTLTGQYKCINQIISRICTFAYTLYLASDKCTALI